MWPNCGQTVAIVHKWTCAHPHEGAAAHESCCPRVCTWYCTSRWKGLHAHFSVHPCTSGISTHANAHSHTLCEQPHPASALTQPANPTSRPRTWYNCGMVIHGDMSHRELQGLLVECSLRAAVFVARLYRYQLHATNLSELWWRNRRHSNTQAFAGQHTQAVWQALCVNASLGTNEAVKSTKHPAGE